MKADLKLKLPSSIALELRTVAKATGIGKKDLARLILRKGLDSLLGGEGITVAAEVTSDSPPPP